VQAKLASEQLVLAAHAAGVVDAVVVNPSGVLGPRDHRLTPATRAILGALHGDPLFLHLCLTHVQDVARGTVLAAQKGKGGQRYLLTGQPQSPAQLRALFSRNAGVRPATFTPPRFLLNFLAGRMEKKARTTGEDAGLTRASLDDVWGKHLAYDSTRARDELGATFVPAEQTLRDTLRWLLFKDAVKPGPAARVRAALGEAAAPEASWVQ
jgi:dihydroflavonol-4-reductase